MNQLVIHNFSILFENDILHMSSLLLSARKILKSVLCLQHFKLFYEEE